MNKIILFLFVGFAAVACNNTTESCTNKNDANLVGNWKLVTGDVTFSLYENGTGSFEMGEQPNTTTIEAARINWTTFNGHTLIWNFYKDKGVWSYWINGDTLNIQDGGMVALNKPTVDEHWQFVRQ